LPWLLLNSAWHSLALRRHTAASLNEREPPSYVVLPPHAAKPADVQGSTASCPPEGSCGGACQWYLASAERRYRLAQNFEGPGLELNGTGEAVCVIPKDAFHVHHTPHAAQQLYKCWSWWRSHPRAQPVLRDETGLLALSPLSPFAGGLYFGFRLLGVHMPDSLTPGQALQAVRPVRHQGWPGDEEQWFLDARHARELRDALVRTTPPGRGPRIGLLQRERVRRLLGEEIIMDALAAVAPVDRATFEHLGFREQAEFMSGHDILVSPHGAQLTAIPFMPDCGGVVELFPRYLWLPGFFGALALNSGLEHLAVYQATVHPDREERASLAADNRTARDLSHKTDLCLSAAEVVRAVQELLGRREKCLAQRGAAVHASM